MVLNTLLIRFLILLYCASIVILQHCNTRAKNVSSLITFRKAGHGCNNIVPDCDESPYKDKQLVLDHISITSCFLIIGA